MPSSFMVRCCVFGILWAIWQAGSSIYVLDSWPNKFTWLKIVSAAAVAFCGGCLTYARDPEAALRANPLVKVIVASIVGIPLLAGCAGQLIQPQNMTPEQLKAWATIKDATLGCAKGVYAGANVVATWANIDKGIPAGVSINDNCAITFDSKRPTPQ